MKLLTIVSCLLAVSVLPILAHSRCRFGPCGGRRYLPRGGRINAETDAEAFGGYTETHGDSHVESGPYGSRGRFSHGARGVGVGFTGARSRGRIDSDGPFGGSSVGSSADANAFGNLHSYSETSGHGSLNNGFGGAGARARSGSAGFGYSNSRTRASAGGYHGRWKRHSGFLLPRGRRVDAGTNAGAIGDFTRTFGDSDVQSGPFGSRGRARHGADARGIGFTGARSSGHVDADEGFFGGARVGSSAGAEAFGNMGSFSSTRGDAGYDNGLMGAGAGSSAGAAGIGGARSRTSATSGGIRFKRSLQTRQKRRTGRYCNFYGKCYDSLDAYARGGAAGDNTRSVGDSSVSGQDGDLFGVATHEAFGEGYGRTGASSQSMLNAGHNYGVDRLRAGADAEAVGDHSSSWTKSKTQFQNGAGFAGSSSGSSASGRGYSSSRSSASASSRRKRDTTNQQELCLDGQCNRHQGNVDGFQVQGRGQIGGAGARANNQAGGYAIDTGIGASGDSWGSASGRSVGASINAEDRFGFRTMESHGSARAQGAGSSWSGGHVEESGGGFGWSRTGSSASLEGDGFSEAHSHTVKNFQRRQNDQQQE